MEVGRQVSVVAGWINKQVGKWTDIDGSVFEPLLFMTYTEDLFDVTAMSLFNYANDETLLPITSALRQYVSATPKIDLSGISSCCKKESMKLNSMKIKG